MSRRRHAAVGAACVLAAACLAGSAGAAPGKVRTVELSGLTFGGKKTYRLQAAVGDSLRFVWAGGLHNVVSGRRPTGTPAVRSKLVRSGPPLVVKLSRAGTYLFVCEPHRFLGMTATVTVT